VPDAADVLAALGWDDRWEAAQRAQAAPGVVGRVARIDRGWSTVWTAEGDARVRNLGADVAVGDWVIISTDGERAAAVLERRSAFVRRAAQRAAAHVVAANADVAALLHALTGRLSDRRLERELVLAFESGAQPVVVLTKADLGKDVAGTMAAAAEVAAGVPVLAVSAATGQGVDDVAALAGPGRTVALLGASGVGKSTLVNALVGSDIQRVGHLRSDDKGRHTTIAAELVRLPRGGMLLDTPGLRSLGLWTDGEGLDRAFADIATLALSCRFPDCRHESEPGCAVRGVVDPVRIAAHRRLRAELDALEDDLSRQRRR
jgi:ribosome biogenesis GTPase / thiamine phosphate phosphatase